MAKDEGLLLLCSHLLLIGLQVLEAFHDGEVLRAGLDALAALRAEFEGGGGGADGRARAEGVPTEAGNAREARNNGCIVRDHASPPQGFKGRDSEALRVSRPSRRPHWLCAGGAMFLLQMRMFRPEVFKVATAEG